jgi:hypothetical protein
MSHPEELGLKPRKPKVKDDSEPDILIIPDDYDPKSGQPPSPMWMVHTKEPEPKLDSVGKTIFQFIVFFLVMAVLYLIFGH